MGKVQVLVPVFGTVTMALISYVLQNDLVLFTFNQRYSELFFVIGYFLAMLQTAIEPNEIVFFYGTWALNGLVVGRLGNRGVKGFVLAFLTTFILFGIYYGFLYIFAPSFWTSITSETQQSIIINQLLIPDTLLPFSLPLSSLILAALLSGTVAAILGSKKTPKVVLNEVVVSNIEPYVLTCPKCQTSRISNSLYCSNCGHQISSNT